MNHNKNGGKKKNTETFKPSHKPTDMRIRAAFVNNPLTQTYTKEMTSRDVLVVHGLFGEEVGHSEKERSGFSISQTSFTALRNH